jgi:hypothetical protein
MQVIGTLSATFSKIAQQRILVVEDGILMKLRLVSYMISWCYPRQSLILRAADGGGNHK